MFPTLWHSKKYNFPPPLSAGVQEKLGIMNGGVVFGVYDYEGQAGDELTFRCGDALTILRRGDEYEREWWWGQLRDIQGYVPRNLLGVRSCCWTFCLRVVGVDGEMKGEVEGSFFGKDGGLF